MRDSRKTWQGEAEDEQDSLFESHLIESPADQNSTSDF